MLHVNIAQLVRPGFVAPGHRSERFRVRSPRKLRPVMPAKENELYYRAELHEIVRGLRAWARQHLIPGLRGHFPGTFAHDAKLAPAAAEVIAEKQRAFAKVGPKSQDLAARVVLKNVRTVDARLAASIRASMDINIEPFLTDTGRIRELMGEQVIKNVELIQSIPSQYFQDVANAVAKNWEAGTNYETLTEAIEHVGDVTDSRAALIARDQTGKLSGAFNQVRQTDLGIEFYGWACTHMRTRPSHLAMETKDVGHGPGVFSWKKPGPLIGAYGVRCHPGADINCRCFPADSQVQYADGVEKAYRRWYSGDLSEVVTGSGKVLRSTPNHPVLTLRGWLPAGVLNERDYVVEVADEVLALAKANGNDRVPLIGEVFQLAADAGLVESRGGVTADFHGDGSNSDIDVVLTGGALRVDVLTRRAQGGAQFNFTKTDLTAPLKRAALKTCKLVAASANLVVRSLGQAMSFFWRGFGHAQPLGFCPATGLDARFEQAPSHHVAVNIEALCNGKFAKTARVEGKHLRGVDVQAVGRRSTLSCVGVDPTRAQDARDKIGAVSDETRGVFQSLPFGYQLSRVVENRRVKWSGHVFNLQTRDGWYVTNGIVAHNCGAVPHVNLSALVDSLGYGAN